MPEISVIVPVYNTEKYLSRCVDSILAQTFTDLELILVDDGSPDDCGRICDEYAERDSRVKVIHQENGGVSAARNRGLDISTGKYIMFCDSDDYVDSEWCKHHIGAIMDYPEAWVVSNYWLSKVSGLLQKKYSGGVVLNTYYDVFCAGLSGNPINKIFDREIISKNNIHFDQAVKIGEDVDFNVKYFKFCKQIHYIDIPLYYYCENENSVLHTYHANWFENQLFPFYIRITVIDTVFLTEYCDRWLSEFINYFDIIFDDRNNANFINKLRYNQKMLNSKEFQFCLANATGKNENPLVLKLLKTKNYYLFYLFIQLVRLKNKLSRK